MGVVRNKARMLARGAGRRRRRETMWAREREADEHPASDDLRAVVEMLPRALKVVAALILSGHTRAEIVWLLSLSDAAFRQRLTALSRALRAAGDAMPPGARTHARSRLRPAERGHAACAAARWRRPCQPRPRRPSYFRALLTRRPAAATGRA